jgi:predicted phage tail protein
MSVLTASPFSLVFDQLVQVHVAAINVVAQGSFSAMNTVGALVKQKPDIMSSLTRGALTSTSLIQVTWTLPTTPANGNSAILSYHLIWDEGLGTTNIDLVGYAVPYTSLSYTISSGISVGNAYKIEIRAKNIYGWGDWSSNTFTVTASDVPAQMAQVANAIESQVDIRFTIAAPVSNGATVDYYQVLIYSQDMLSLTEDVANCPGNVATITTLSYCDISMSSLRTNYGYTLNSLVKAVVRAHNSNGWGPKSEVNTVGALIATEPVQMTSLAYDSVLSTLSNIRITWTEPTGLATGNSPILSYEI